MEENKLNKICEDALNGNEDAFKVIQELSKEMKINIIHNVKEMNNLLIKNQNETKIDNLELNKQNKNEKKEQLKEISKELKLKEEDLKTKEKILLDIKNYIEIKLSEIKEETKIDFLFSKIEKCEIQDKNVEKMKYFNILNEVIKKINNVEEIKKMIDEKKLKLNYVEGNKHKFGYGYIGKISIQRMDANKTIEVIQKLCEIFDIKFYIKIKLVDDKIYEWKN